MTASIATGEDFPIVLYGVQHGLRSPVNVVHLFSIVHELLQGLQGLLEM
jgi:hypothetical protein